MPLKIASLFLIFLHSYLCFAQTNPARVVVQLGKQKNMISGDFNGGDVFSPDSKYILTYGGDGSYIIWDIRTGRQIQELYTGRMPMTNNDEKYSGYSSQSRPSMSADNKYCITEGTESHSYILWDIVTGKKVKEFGPNCIQAVFSANGKFVATNSAQHAIWTIGLYDIEKGDYNANLITYRGAARSDGKIAVWGEEKIHMNFFPYCFAISPDLTKIGLGLYDGRTVAFDIKELKKKARDGLAEMKDMQVVMPDDLGCGTNIAFAEDSRRLISKNENVVIVWDMAKRKIVQSIAIPPHKRFIEDSPLSNTGKWVETRDAYMSDDCKTLVYWTKPDANPSGRMNFYNVPDGKFLYAVEGGYHNDNREIGDTVSLTNISGLSNNRKYFYYGYVGEQNEILGSDGRIVQMLQGETITLTNAGFLENDNKIFIGKSLNDAFIFDFGTGACKRMRTFFYSGDTSHNGKMSYSQPNSVYFSNNVSFSPDKSLVVTYDLVPSNYTPYLYIWDARQMKVIKQIEMGTDSLWYPPFYTTRISGDNKNIIFSLGGIVYNLPKNKMQRLPVNCSPVFSSDNKSLIYGEGKSDKNIIHIFLKTIDLATLKITKSTELKHSKPIRDITDSLSKALSTSISPNYYFTPTINNGKVYEYHDNRILAFDVATGKEVLNFDDSQGFNSFSNRREGLDVNKWEISEDGSLLASAGDGNNRKIYVYDLKHPGPPIQTFSGYKNEITSLSFSRDNKRLLSVSADRTAILWDLSNGGQIILFAAYSDNDYVIATPDGYYMTTKTGAQALHFVKGITPYLFSQFDLQYNRPDKVLERIGMASPSTIQAYKKAYQKRLQKMGFDPENFEKEISFDVPETEVKNKPDTVQMVKNKDYKILLNAKDKLYELNRINIYVNGVQGFGVRGIDLTKYHSKDYETDVTVTLSKGLNVIEVSALNEKGTESLTERFQVYYKPPAIEKPNLYIVAIGDSKYSNPVLNLTYAAKDANDLASLFQDSRDYNKVIPILLTDEQVTRENVLKIKEQLLKSDVDDKVIVFYAGHGVFSSSLDYYLGTTNMDFLNPQKNGLLYEDLENLVDGIPARNKLLLVDACHSGEIDKEEAGLVAAKKTTSGLVKFRAVGNNTIEQKSTGLENSFEMMKQLFTDLRKATGATVISSAGGGEYAMEGDKWKNGVFTYCLLSGIKEKKADLNKDGKIMVSELQKYVQKQVQELTGGKQTPTSRIENLVNDFQVW